ncbi:MAG: peptidyl-prolyl cis-trans isomerase [Phycisphaerales bacterium]|nr:MAG: peptidyl-prolyl cis-trans isomerase [Phycisphaerales bacterium]
MKHESLKTPTPWRLSLLLVIAPLFAACVAPARERTSTVADAWDERQQAPAPEPEPDVAPEPDWPAPTARRTSSVEERIATVDGKPVARSQVVDLLLRGHGSGILEQIIVLQRAKDLAAERGITVNRDDVDREYEQALRRLTDPLFSKSPESFDHDAAERVLVRVLSERNISREEYMLGMRRNAYLRALVQADIQMSDGELRDEYARAYSERASVRHVQVATPREAARVHELLNAGESFESVARQYSANTATAANGGLLEPFSQYEQDVPALFRETAFKLKPGQVSATIRVGAWYHILRLERRLPAQDVDFEEVRDELRRRILEQRTEPAMQKLYEELFREADVRIHDPALREAFEAKHPKRRR